MNHFFTSSFSWYIVEAGRSKFILHLPLMRHAKIVFALLIASVISVLLLTRFPAKTRADVDEVPMPGAMITAGDENEQVRMKSEGVVFTVKNPDMKSGELCPFTINNGIDCWYAEVDAVFTMENISGSDVTLDLFYPYPSMLDVWGGNVGSAIEDHSKNFSVNVRDSYLDYSVTSYPMLYEGNETTIPSLSFPVTFPAGEETEIWINYETRLVDEPKSQYGSFIYLMETGSHWAGSIGSGWLRFKFQDEIFPFMFSDLSEDFVIEGNELTWSFSELEPDAEDNKRVTFCPSLYTLWSNRPEYLESVSTSPYEESSSAVGIDAMLLPDVYQYLPSTMVVANSPIFLLDPVIPGENTEEYYPNWGWVADYEYGSSPYVQYELDAVYQVSGLEIFAGIPIYLVNLKTLDEGVQHTILDRPKEMLLTFSDGSTETVTLEDRPDVLQTVTFDTVETSSVKVQFVDSYASEITAKSALGLSRLYLEVGEKVREKEDAVVEVGDDDVVEDAPVVINNSGNDTAGGSFWSNLNDTTKALAAVGITTVVLGTAVTVGYAATGKIKFRKAGSGAGKEIGKANTGKGAVEGGIERAGIAAGNIDTASGKGLGNGKSEAGSNAGGTGTEVGK